ncbi:MAG: hypothetical protein HY905_08415 [Deltaproteobacteria bacterium]|nr:hypothetical protein [Deltaproteobacteria bacterium]
MPSRPGAGALLATIERRQDNIGTGCYEIGRAGGAPHRAPGDPAWSLNLLLDP